MGLTKEQEQQINKQLQGHKHDNYTTDIHIDDMLDLEGFNVHQDVLRPEQMAALYLARYLFFNNGLYADKRVVDMGCGTGIQGITCALRGARSVTLSDIAAEAVANTQANIEQFDVGSVASVVQGDLFEKVKGKADVIIFNHPFFPEAPQDDVPVSRTMLDAGGLLQRFLHEVPRYIDPDGVVIMPYYDLAGEVNDPGIQGAKNGYDVSLRFNLESGQGLQKEGNILIYELRIPKLS